MKATKLMRHALAAMMAAVLAFNVTAVSAAERADQSAQVQQRVNVNKASADALQAVNGLGPSKARAIVEHREKFGNFKSGDDLLAVDGIGPATLKRIQPQLSF